MRNPARRQRRPKRRLIIPRSQLKQLRAALGRFGHGRHRKYGDERDAHMQTIVSGLFLSLAIVFGGVWFSRKRQTDGKINKTIAAGVVVLLVGSAATIAFANVGPPPQLRSISSKLFNRDTFKGWNSAYGKVKIEVSDDDGSIELIVPDKEEAQK